MAFNSQPGSSSQAFNTSPFSQYGNPPRAGSRHAAAAAPTFDILEWYPQFQSCHKYFLDHAQHTLAVQALAAFINIQLPYQKHPFPIMSSSASSPRSTNPEIPQLRQQLAFSPPQTSAQAQAVSLIPYIRRLVATGHDTPPILHGFFGDDWVGGIGELHEIERRNFLFAAKSTSWVKVKQAYDLSPGETIPFLKPLQNASETEIQAAEAGWSEWLAMQDWMLGPRAPENMKDVPRVKREQE